MLFHYTVFNEDYISIYTLWLVPLPFLYCVFAGLVAWRLSLPPLSSDPGFAPGHGSKLSWYFYLNFFRHWGCWFTVKFSRQETSVDHISIIHLTSLWLSKSSHQQKTTQPNKKNDGQKEGLNSSCAHHTTASRISSAFTFFFTSVWEGDFHVFRSVISFTGLLQSGVAASKREEETRGGLRLRPVVRVDRDAGRKIRRASSVSWARCCVVDSIGGRAYPRGLDADTVWRVLV
jgi:hypothetical protein